MSTPITSTTMQDPIAEQFRLAMRRMAASVCIASAVDRAGRPQAMTATSVNSLSMEPPTLLLCVNRLAGIHTAIVESNSFCINILHNRQKSIADMCSQRRLEESYLRQPPWQSSESGIPYLPESLACVFCALDRVIEYSTHSIFLGLVTRSLVQEEIAPLIHFDGHYRIHGSTVTK